MSGLDWPEDGPLAQVLPASDLVVADMRRCAADVREHDHPRGEDFYCLNLTAYMGERMAYVLRRLAESEAETQRWKDRCSALADHALELGGTNLVDHMDELGPR